MLSNVEKKRQSADTIQSCWLDIKVLFSVTCSEVEDPFSFKTI